MFDICFQESATYTCEVYDSRTKFAPQGDTLHERQCSNECVRKNVTVHVAKNKQETCSGSGQDLQVDMPHTLKVIW